MLFFFPLLSFPIWVEVNVSFELTMMLSCSAVVASNSINGAYPLEWLLNVYDQHLICLFSFTLIRVLRLLIRAILSLQKTLRGLSRHKKLIEFRYFFIFPTHLYDWIFFVNSLCALNCITSIILAVCSTTINWPLLLQILLGYHQNCLFLLPYLENITFKSRALDFFTRKSRVIFYLYHVLVVLSPSFNFSWPKSDF